MQEEKNKQVIREFARTFKNEHDVDGVTRELLLDPIADVDVAGSDERPHADGGRGAGSDVGGGVGGLHVTHSDFSRNRIDATVVPRCSSWNRCA